MKRVDLEDGQRGFVYEGTPGGPKMSEKHTRQALELLSQIFGPPMRWMNSTMGELIQQEVHGVYITMRPDGYLLNVTASADDVRATIRALEMALERMREALKKEES